MAITLDGAPLNSGSTSSPCTISSVPVSTGNLMVVAIAVRTNTGGAVSGVTFNGSSAGWTQDVAVDPGGDYLVSIWSKKSPTATTADVVITTSNVPVWIAAQVYVFNGADTTTQPNDTDSPSFVGGGASASLSGLTTTVDGCAVVDIIQDSGNSPTMTAETNRTAYMIRSPDTSTRFGASSLILTESPAGSPTMQWTFSGGNNAQMAAVAYQPGATSSGPTKVGSMLRMFQ